MNDEPKQDFKKALDQLQKSNDVFGSYLPLKIGIGKDKSFRALFPELSFAQFKKMLTLHIKSIAYIEKQLKPGPRYDFDGSICGEVTAAQAKTQTGRLKSRLKAEEAKVPAEPDTIIKATPRVAKTALQPVSAPKVKAAPIITMKRKKRQLDPMLSKAS